MPNNGSEQRQRLDQLLAPSTSSRMRRSRRASRSITTSAAARALTGTVPVAELARAGQQLLPGRALRREQLPARSRHQGARAQQHLHPESVDACSRLRYGHEHLRRQQLRCRSTSTRTTFGWNKAFADAIPVQKFPTFVVHRATAAPASPARPTGSTTRSGVNGALTKLAGEHSFKFGGDYRILGVKSTSPSARRPAATRSTASTPQHARPPAARRRGNAIADLLLGDISAAAITLNTPVDDYIRYSSVCVQDDWRPSQRLTVNYGVRLEHETGIAEREQQPRHRLRSERPSARSASRFRPAPIRCIPKRARSRAACCYAGVNGQQTATGKALAIKAVAARRRGLLADADDGHPRRIRPVLGAVELRHDQLGRLLADDEQPEHEHQPARHDRQPVPERAAAARRQLARPDRRREQRRQLLRSELDARRACSSTRSISSASCRMR